MTENEIAKTVVDVVFRIHRDLGPGLFESVYESIIEYELTQEKRLFVQRQPTLPVFWKTIKLDLGFRPDIIIENKLILELKSVESVTPVHYKQLQTYLRLSDIKLGLMINFNEEIIKKGIKRVVNGL